MYAQYLSNHKSHVYSPDTLYRPEGNIVAKCLSEFVKEITSDAENH